MDTDDMGGLGEFLAPILSDPETMEKLRQEAEKLGLSGLGAFGGGNGPQEQTSAPGGASGNGSAGASPGDMNDIGALLARLMPLISGLSEEDDSSRLLRALRPFLSEKRGKRLDEANKMLTLMRVIRMLPDAGPRQ